MNRHSPPPNALNTWEGPLRVRFVPLWRWYFVGSFLLIETFLASRFWGGWSFIALLRMLAIQILFAPRLMLIAAGVSLLATVLSERMVKWIARPLSDRWLSPTNGLPPESELPLYLRMGETAQNQLRGRRRAEQTWEPGWLIVTDQRVFWLSGVWRTIVWELDRNTGDESLRDRFRLSRPPRWMGGFVVGMPPRLIVDISKDVNDSPILETIAIAIPEKLFESIGSFEKAEVAEFLSESAEPAKLTEKPATRRMDDRPADEIVSTPIGNEIENAPRSDLPPRRRLPHRHRPQRQDSSVSDDKSADPDNTPKIERYLRLPPRRRLG